ncbi:UNVERIFIED_CONTAM: hypothetical protein Sindi_0060400, partial [Sesamum indicum]
MTGLTQEFQDGVATFIQWAKSQRADMDGEKNNYPCRKCKNEVFKTTGEVLYRSIMIGLLMTRRGWEYFEPVKAAPLVRIRNGVMQRRWIGHRRWFFMQPDRLSGLLIITRMVCLIMGPLRLCIRAGDQFHDVVHAGEQPLWKNCIQFQLRAVAELVNIKVEGHISQHIYKRISQCADYILPHNHTLPQDYYSTKKLRRDLGLPIEKIDACKNACMLYWMDNIDPDYYKSCGESRYKLTRERNSNRKKTRYAILSNLPITPRLQRLYALEATVEQMMWHANHQTEEGPMCHPSDVEALRHFDRNIPILQQSSI